LLFELKHQKIILILDRATNN